MTLQQQGKPNILRLWVNKESNFSPDGKTAPAWWIMEKSVLLFFHYCFWTHKEQLEGTSRSMTDLCFLENIVKNLQHGEIVFSIRRYPLHLRLFALMSIVTLWKLNTRVFIKETDGEIRLKKKNFGLPAGNSVQPFCSLCSSSSLKLHYESCFWWH